MRVLSGTQPTQDYLHIGNYFGALRQYVSFQEKYEEALYFVADYHSMTSVRDAAARRRYTRNVALDYLGAGVDPERSILFRQSDVPEVCELAWLLSTVTPMGMLERAHAYKDKVANGLSADHGLFAYPVLMAADILAYRSNLVPVGRDQVQHVEMTQDMAQAFNHRYGEVFARPEVRLSPTPKVPGVDGQKMSKSYGNTIEVFAEGKALKKSVMGIVTDSTELGQPLDPDGCTVFKLFSLFAGAEEREAMAGRYRAGDIGYGEAKQTLLARVDEFFAPARAKRRALLDHPDEIEDVLRQGAQRARAEAASVLDLARKAAGLASQE
jgi:tryptophanyl-tRNA synthetase